VEKKSLSKFCTPFESLQMRFVLTIVAALIILGLAAFGLVSAQKGATPTATAASTVRVASATRNVLALPARTPVSQIAQATGSETPVTATTPSRPPAALPAPAPTRLARTTPAPASSAASTPAPNASAQNKPASNIPASVGTHTWSHKDLARNPYAKDLDQAKQEIEMGNSAVPRAAAGAPVSPFFRFPDLQHPPPLVSYLGERNIAIFSTDIDSFDFKIRKPDEVVKSVMTKLEKHGKGIILMHDFQHATAEALPELIRQLKAGGYKVVHMVPRQLLTTIPKYDEMVTQQGKLSSNNMRPETNVIRTIGGRVLEPWSFEPPSSGGTSKSSSPGSGGAGG
jgi:hypothetical protein